VRGRRLGAAISSAGRDFCPPVKKEIHKNKTPGEVPGQVLGPKGGEGREGGWEPGRAWVGFWGGAGDPEGGKAPPISAVGDNGGMACFAGKDGYRRGEKVVCCPSLDSVPEAVHASECGGIWGEEVCSVSEYRQQEAMGDKVALCNEIYYYHYYSLT